MCRHINISRNDQLPIVFTSKQAERDLVGGQSRRTAVTGLYRLTPDYEGTMNFINCQGDRFPRDSNDLVPYSNWKVSTKHMDYGYYQKHCANTFLLRGKPQIGKKTQ